MAVEGSTEARSVSSRVEWQAGAIGGLVAGVVMGGMLQMMMTPVITKAIPALYGMDGMVMGWVAHLFHSLIFGLIFAGIVMATPQLRGYADKVTTSTGLGIAYGVIIWVVAAAIVMPIWLSAVGFPGAPPLPNFNPMSLVGHVVYGALLGVLFPLVHQRE